MARVELISDEQAKNDPLTEALFDGARRLLGRVPNAIRARGALPQIAVWALALTASLQREGGGGTLDGRTKELIVLKTSMANACKYCVAHNTALGLATGISEGQIEDMQGDYATSKRLSDRDKAVLRWAEAVTLNEAGRDKAAFEDLKKHFSDSEIIEITWVSAMFNMSNRMQDSLQIDVEAEDEVNLIKKSKLTSEEAILEVMEGIVQAMKERLRAREAA